MYTILILTFLFSSSLEFLQDYNITDRNGDKVSIYNGIYYAIRNRGSGNYFSPGSTHLSNDLNNNDGKNWAKVTHDSNNNAELKFKNNKYFRFNLTKDSEHYMIGKIIIF